MDRAFLYGDRFFDTIIYRNRQIEFWKYHLERIRASAQVLYFENIATKSEHEWLQEIDCILELRHLKNQTCRIRIVAFREEGGFYRPEKKQARYLIEIQVMDFFPSSIVEKVDFARTVQTYYTCYSPYKIHTIPYVLAGIEANERNLDDLILTSPQGYISEAISSNLFWYYNGIFYTPLLETGCVAGVVRRAILEYFKSKKIPFQEIACKRDFFLNAEHIWFVNVTGIRNVRRIMECEYTVKPFPIQFGELLAALS
ncbi:MAG: aminotransferase class IV [Cytophagales bacterium]|nr:aminotransferase class IV [Cytophagales bacterium]MDW8384637.1 aminotransferase class IV [Flammeovirgaceae bacterium]